MAGNGTLCLMRKKVLTHFFRTKLSPAEQFRNFMIKNKRSIPAVLLFVFLVEVAGLELAASSTRSRKNMFFEHHCLHIVRIFREIASFCTLFPLFPNSPIPVVVSYVVKTKMRLKAENGELDKAFLPIYKPYPC